MNSPTMPTRNQRATSKQQSETKTPRTSPSKKQRPGLSRARILPSENPIKAFVSSVMRPDLDWARAQSFEILNRRNWFVPWMFEHTPASSEGTEQNYLRHVRESDLVIWLVGSETTQPVEKEIVEALATNRRLLVFRLPSVQRDEATKSLILKVGQQAKWIDIQHPEEFSEILQLSIGDEICRAMRAKPGMARIARLQELMQASRARCIERWQAAGVPLNVASEFADDPSIGNTDLDWSRKIDQSIILLMGQLGSGKSLLAERRLQSAIQDAVENINAPVPIYIDTKNPMIDLQKEIELAANGVGDPHIVGVNIVFDGIDELGSDRATDYLSQSRILARTWPNSLFLLTSRPLPDLSDVEEAVQVPNLTSERAFAIMSRLANRSILPVNAYRWPKSIQDASLRPLYAILLGNYLREQSSMQPRSTGELLSSLIERSLKRVSLGHTRVGEMLRRLAVLSTDRSGGLVPDAEVGSQSDLNALFDSRLIIKRKAGIAFGLPILTQWFAAQSLPLGLPSIIEVVADRQRLENWRYPLVIATATFNNEEASTLLVPLAEENPGFTSEIVNDALAQPGLGESVQPPPAAEAGHRIRVAMTAWVNGIGPLAQFIAPIRTDQTLLPLSVARHEDRLETAWYHGKQPMPEIIVTKVAAGRGDFPLVRSGLTGHQATWAWRWALEDLVSALSRLLQGRNLPLPRGPLQHEIIWKAALLLTGKGSLYSKPIALDEIEKKVSHLSVEHRNYIQGWEIPLTDLWNELRIRREKGESELPPPWPGPDRQNAGNWVWSPYSDAQTLARATKIYSASLEAYQKLVEKWFPKFVSSFSIASLLPARLIGVITPDEPYGQVGPGIDYFFEQLPLGSKSGVDIKLRNTAKEKYELNITPIKLHPQTVRSIETIESILPEGLTIHPRIPKFFHNARLDIFHTTPAIELTYSWLWNDLSRLSWVDGALGYRS